jgi:hypothetical protein
MTNAAAGWWSGALLAIIGEMWVMYLTRVNMPAWCFFGIWLGTLALGIGMAVHVQRAEDR